MRLRSRELIWAATVGIVLADSSIVTLALPAILARFDATVLEVSWVLTSFNIVLALLVLPAARLAAGGGAVRAVRVWASGVVVFAAGSLACALAPSAALLIAGRCVQAGGGAVVIAGAVELLARSRGSHARGAGVWGAAGLVGLAIGPAAGGVLTEMISWQSIFAVQVPVAALAVMAARPPAGAPERGRSARLSFAPELALALLSAGLAGALFLLVILLTEGWGASPLEAALVVSAIPASTLLARAVTRRAAASTPMMVAGAVALAGGLAALGLLPDAEPVWTLAPQALIGIGIALTLPGLTARALGGADPAGRRAAGTIAARHVGIVLGIVLLTPLFAAELTAQGDAAQRSGTALILDAGLSPETKIELGTAVAEEAKRRGGRLTDLSPAFARAMPPPEGRAEYARLEEQLGEEVDRAATSAFSTVFLVAAALALLAVGPILLSGGGSGGGRRAGAAALVFSVLASGGLVAVHLARGGATYEPLEVADPCKPRRADRLQGRDQVLQRIGLSALDGAACRLRVTREELVLALADEDARRAFAAEHRISDPALQRAVRSGLERAIDEAVAGKAISPFEAALLSRAVSALPVATLIDALGTSVGKGVLGFLTDLLRRSGP